MTIHNKQEHDYTPRCWLNHQCPEVESNENQAGSIEADK